MSNEQTVTWGIPGAQTYSADDIETISLEESNSILIDEGYVLIVTNRELAQCFLCGEPIPRHRATHMVGMPPDEHVIGFAHHPCMLKEIEAHGFGSGEKSKRDMAELRERLRRKRDEERTKDD